MDEAAELNRLYGLPLDEFVKERDALAKRLRGEDREAAAAVKALRKPTVGAWALNQAIRRRRSETDELLETADALRDAYRDMLSGGDPAAVRAATERERALSGTLADCAEAIATETGKSGPALRERVRATLRAAVLSEEVREELREGRFVREREASGLGTLEGPLPEAPPPAKRGGERAAKSERKGRTKRAGAERAGGESTAAQRAGAEQADGKRAAAAAAAAERAAAADRALADAEAELADARTAHERAAADQGAAVETLDAARDALLEAELAERETRRLSRETERELAKQERRVERLRR